MADNHNQQYTDASKQLVNLGNVTSTGLHGSSPSEAAPPATLQHGQLGSGLPVGSGEDVTHTGAPGSTGPVPPADGSTATVTDAGHTGVAEGHTKSGTTNTNKEHIGDALNIQGSFGGGSFPDDSTGAGHGSSRTERP